MTTIISRTSKGSPLTNVEIDANFTNLNTDKAERVNGVLVTPNLGTPTSLILTSATGLPVATGISGLASGIASFLAVPSSANLAAALTDETGSGANVFATNPVLVTPNLGTPTSLILTSATGLPVATGISGLASGISSFLAVASSANLAAAMSDETGTGALVFATSPTLVTPALGTPSALIGTNITGTAAGFTAGTVTTNANLTGHITSTGNAAILGSFSSANLLAALTDKTGTGANVFATSPTLVTPVLGTPSSGTLSSCTVDGTDLVGFKNIPVNSQSAAYTTVLADSGKVLLHPSADTTARTYTIAANASVAYPLGTTITFVNMSTATVTIAIATDTLYLSPSGATGSFSLSQYGSATAIKITTTNWIIGGSGLL